MSDELSVLVFGIDELASAIAHKLHLDGHAVALHQAPAPTTIRRRMAFSDGWHDGSVTLDGVEARRCDQSKPFLAGLSSGQFIPILADPLEDAMARWPWDIVVDARPADGGRERIKDLAELTIGVGAGFVAGETCHFVIDTRGRDPGAILRHGSMAKPSPKRDDPFADACLVVNEEAGPFHVSRFIGESVSRGDILGFAGTRALEAPIAGRLRGLARDGAQLESGCAAADIATSPRAEVVGMCLRDRLVARSVAFVIEMERGGWEPVSLESLISKP
jgi:xanthine dehydrogenase accessory factor